MSAGYSAPFPAAIACPTCHVSAGQPCDDRGGFHFARVLKAEAAAVGNTDDTEE